MHPVAVISGHPLLTEAAAACVRQWEFEAARKGRETVETVGTVEVNFKLR